MKPQLDELFQFPRNDFLEFVLASILISKATFYKESFEFIIPSIHIIKETPTGVTITTDDVVKATISYVEEALMAGEHYLCSMMQIDAYLTDYSLATALWGISAELSKVIEAAKPFSLRVRYNARLMNTVEYECYHN